MQPTAQTVPLTPACCRLTPWPVSDRALSAFQACPQSPSASSSFPCSCRPMYEKQLLSARPCFCALCQLSGQTSGRFPESASSPASDWRQIPCPAGLPLPWPLGTAASGPASCTEARHALFRQFLQFGQSGQFGEPPWLPLSPESPNLRLLEPHAVQGTSLVSVPAISCPRGQAATPNKDVQLSTL